jgi:hypothetical protein
MDNQKCSAPAQELVYFSLITQCVGLVEIIKNKTSFIQEEEKPVEACEKPIVNRKSLLEEKLLGLLEDLRSLENSYKL